jgi:hypothetical protein
MSRSTTSKGSQSKLVWEDEFDDPEFDLTKRDFELGTKFFDAMSGQGIVPEHQRFIDHYGRGRA